MAYVRRRLDRERVDSLIKETHNLGVRTRAKYDRTTEAVALLSMSLLAFALGVILVAIVATAPPGMRPIHMTLVQRIILGGIFASYCWIQLHSQIGYSHMAVDEVPARRDRLGAAQIRWSAAVCDYAAIAAHRDT